MSGTEHCFVPVNYGADPGCQCRNSHGEIHVSFQGDERASLSLLFAEWIETYERGYISYL